MFAIKRRSLAANYKLLVDQEPASRAGLYSQSPIIPAQKETFTWDTAFPKTSKMPGDQYHQKSMADTPSIPNTTSVTEAYLERLTKASIACINAHDFFFTSPSGREVFAHVAPDFTAQLARWPGRILTWDEICETWAGHIGVNDNMIINSCSSVVQKSSATVWLELEATGVSPRTRLNIVAEFRWRREVESGEWVWWKYVLTFLLM